MKCLPSIFLFFLLLDVRVILSCTCCCNGCKNVEGSKSELVKSNVLPKNLKLNDINFGIGDAGEKVDNNGKKKEEDNNLIKKDNVYSGKINEIFTSDDKVDINNVSKKEKEEEEDNEKKIKEEEDSKKGIKEEEDNEKKININTIVTTEKIIGKDNNENKNISTIKDIKINNTLQDNNIKNTANIYTNIVDKKEKNDLQMGNVNTKIINNISFEGELNNKSNNFNYQGNNLSNNNQNNYIDNNKLNTNNVNNNINSNCNINTNSSTNGSSNNNQNNYIFPLVGLNNVGSTCFMNATLQCLLHISELNSYFLTEYPNDHLVLNSKNASSDTKGNISLAYYNVVNGVYLQNLQYFNNPYMYNSFAPRDFKEILGSYNSQFRFYEANDSKDLILYLLQTFHEELNYFGDKAFPVAMPRPNQENRPETFNYFMTTYNIQNFSIISKLFYGTYENTIKCCNCNRVYFSYQKFEFISFSTYNYRNSVFNIYNGFQDNQNTQYLRGNNQYFCPACQSLQNGETCCKIIQPPSKLIINIDYGKNKIYQVRRLIFDEMIDITRFINFNFGKNIIYQISGVCTHLGSSGPSGHYIAYCRNKQNGLWYKFDDSCVSQVQKDEIYNGSPYLLLYEQI